VITDLRGRSEGGRRGLGKLLDNGSRSVISFTQCMNIKERKYETNGFFIF